VGALAVLEPPTVPLVVEVGGPAHGRTPHPGGDRVTVDRLRAGDDTALAAVFDRHGDVVFGIARRVTADGQAARDVTQEVFAHLWEHPERVDLDRGSLRTYLAVLAHRRAVDEVRRRTRRSAAEARAASRVEPAVDDHGGDIAEGASIEWRRQRLGVVLETLPEDQRRALHLAYFEGCTYKQVAERLGIPEGTAKSRLRLALARLRAALSEEVTA
jgi:RNA polymerase sigma-70 factor (ECF subfamily)